MASHGSITDTRSRGGFTLRELDDSRRGARFTNKKEDKLLERRLAYLAKQNKRAQTSINREKEFIKTRNNLESDKEMNHLDRRYKEAMGFIMDYKSTPLVKPETDVPAILNHKKTAWAKCTAIQRIRSAPNSLQMKRKNRHDSNSSTECRKEAWLSQRVSKMSLDSEATSSLRSDSSDSGSEEDEYVFKPFHTRKLTDHGRIGSSVGSTTDSSKGTSSTSSAGSRVALSTRSGGGQYHRAASGVKNESFWSVLRNNTTTRPSVVMESEETSAGTGVRNKLAAKAKDIMIEQRVVKLFLEIDKMKHSPVNLPNI